MPVVLTQRSLVSYLLQHGLVDARSIIESDLEVVDTSHRNLNFRVSSEHGPSYWVKQGVGAGRSSTIEHEARVYEVLATAPASGNSFERFLPSMCFYDVEEHVLLLELFRNAENLLDFLYRAGRVPVALASLIGEALGTLHSTFSGRDVARSNFLPPAVFSIYRPHLRFLDTLSNANHQLVRALQKFPQIPQGLTQLNAEWKPQTLIHGDIKLENLITLHGEGRDGTFARGHRRVGKDGKIGGSSGRGHEWKGERVRDTRMGDWDLKLVDWEFAGLGDPCWDVGSFFADFLRQWLFSLPVATGEPLDRLLSFSAFPLEAMQPAMRAFWRAYSKRMGFDPIGARTALAQSTRYAAGRLVQSAFEELQGTAFMAGNVAYLLQVSLYILQRPRQAALSLLGIDL